MYIYIKIRISVEIIKKKIDKISSYYKTIKLIKMKIILKV